MKTSEVVLQFLQKNADNEYTAAMVSDFVDLTVKQVNTGFNALVKKHLGYRKEIAHPHDTKKNIKFLKLTDEGKAAKVGEE